MVEFDAEMYVGKGAAWAAGLIWDELHREDIIKRVRVK